MLSDLIHTPEFAVPAPRWLSGAALALSALFIALLLVLPPQPAAAPSTTIASFGH